MTVPAHEGSGVTAAILAERQRLQQSFLVHMTELGSWTTQPVMAHKARWFGQRKIVAARGWLLSPVSEAAATVDSGAPVVHTVLTMQGDWIGAVRSPGDGSLWRWDGDWAPPSTELDWLAVVESLSALAALHGITLA